MSLGSKLPDELNRIKHTNISWTHDSQGIFYSCYPDFRPDNKLYENTQNKLCYHKIGTNQDKDLVVTKFTETSEKIYV